MTALYDLGYFEAFIFSLVFVNIPFEERVPGHVGENIHRSAHE